MGLSGGGGVDYVLVQTLKIENCTAHHEIVETKEF